MEGAKIEVIEEHNGLTYVVLVILRFGHRCGYVGVNRDHKLYGLEYNENSYIFDGCSPDGIFNVHGGLTFSGTMEDIDPELWFFGYDCNHLGDSPDPEFLDEDYAWSASFTRELSNVRSTRYCVDQCIKLADQISKY